MMAFSMLEYLFLEIFTFLYYANKQSETRNQEHLQNITAVTSNLAPDMQITRETD